MNTAPAMPAIRAETTERFICASRTQRIAPGAKRNEWVACAPWRFDKENLRAAKETVNKNTRFSLMQGRKAFASVFSGPNDSRYEPHVRSGDLMDNDRQALPFRAWIAL
jgi:hypothetical protein